MVQNVFFFYCAHYAICYKVKAIENTYLCFILFFFYFIDQVSVFGLKFWGKKTALSLHYRTLDHRLYNHTRLWTLYLASFYPACSLWIPQEDKGIKPQLQTLDYARKIEIAFLKSHSKSNLPLIRFCSFFNSSCKESRSRGKRNNKSHLTLYLFTSNRNCMMIQR